MERRPRGGTSEKKGISMDSDVWAKLDALVIETDVNRSQLLQMSAEAMLWNVKRRRGSIWKRIKGEGND